MRRLIRLPSVRSPFSVAALAVATLVAQPACEGDDGSSSSSDVILGDPSDLPIADLPDELRAAFRKGDANFEAIFRDANGLGPVYIRHSCNSCHAADGRGPGSVHKMAIMEADGVTASADQSLLEFGHTVRPQTSGNATVGIIIPEAAPGLLVTNRAAPPVFGRGYIEAIADSEIERMVAIQAARGDAITGTIHRVSYQSQANPDTRFHTFQPGQPNLIGRFGLKARIATLDDFTADALQGDMGITSPLRPDELPMPLGYEDGKPGIDTDADLVNSIADYVRLISIPPRRDLPARGPELFAASQCDACHTPSLKTRVDYPIAVLAGIDAPIYSDLLLHDMGKDAADGLADGDALSTEWKTAPLLGLRHMTSYLHDGSATTIRDAILLHQSEGSEANNSIALYLQMSAQDQAILDEFVGKL